MVKRDREVSIDLVHKTMNVICSRQRKLNESSFSDFVKSKDPTQSSILSFSLS
jgi:hypothetical protein